MWHGRRRMIVPRRWMTCCARACHGTRRLRIAVPWIPRGRVLTLCRVSTLLYRARQVGMRLGAPRKVACAVGPHRRAGRPGSVWGLGYRAGTWRAHILGTRRLSKWRRRRTTLASIRSIDAVGRRRAKRNLLRRVVVARQGSSWRRLDGGSVVEVRRRTGLNRGRRLRVLLLMLLLRSWSRMRRWFRRG